MDPRNRIGMILPCLKLFVGTPAQCPDFVAVRAPLKAFGFRINLTYNTGYKAHSIKTKAIS